MKAIEAILIGEDDVSEQDWMRAAAEEAIYTLEDGKPFNGSR